MKLNWGFEENEEDEVCNSDSGEGGNWEDEVLTLELKPSESEDVPRSNAESHWPKPKSK